MNSGSKRFFRALLLFLTSVLILALGAFLIFQIFAKKFEHLTATHPTIQIDQANATSLEKDEKYTLFYIQSTEEAGEMSAEEIRSILEVRCFESSSREKVVIEDSSSFSYSINGKKYIALWDIRPPKSSDYSFEFTALDSVDALELSLALQKNTLATLFSIVMKLFLYGGGVVLLAFVVFILGVIQIAQGKKPEDPGDLNPSDEDRWWAMLAHLLTLSCYLIPMANFIIPLVILATKGKNSPYVKIHCKEVLNFQLSMMIYFFAAILLCFLLIGFFLLMVLPIISLIFTIQAAIEAHHSKLYRYPLSISIIR